MYIFSTYRYLCRTRIIHSLRTRQIRNNLVKPLKLLKNLISVTLHWRKTYNYHICTVLGTHIFKRIRILRLSRNVGKCFISCIAWFVFFRSSHKKKKKIGRYLNYSKTALLQFCMHVICSEKRMCIVFYLRTFKTILMSQFM